MVTLGLYLVWSWLVHGTTTMAHRRISFNVERDESLYNCESCNSIDTDEMVQCDKCNAWFHYECAGAHITHDVANYSWNCEKCIRGQIKMTLRNQQTTPTFQDNASSVMDSSRDVQSVERQMFTGGNKDIVLQFMRAKQKLEEEQLNKSFEIQQKFLLERFNVLVRQCEVKI